MGCVVASEHVRINFSLCQTLCDSLFLPLSCLRGQERIIITYFMTSSNSSVAVLSRLPCARWGVGVDLLLDSWSKIRLYRFQLSN